MKKHSYDLLFKRKLFYISLITGVLAIFFIGVLSLKMLSVNKKDNLADLNEPPVNMAYNVRDNVEKSQNEKVQSNQNDLQSKKTEEKVTPTVTPKPEVTATPPVQTAAAMEEKKQENSVAVNKTTEKNGAKAAAVMTTEGRISNLKFNEVKGLLWPVAGDVILNYSMSNTIYFQTLAQYKCNPAIVISVKEGTEVKCAADAVITNIVNDVETGWTVTTSIGSGYKVIYGQLKEGLEWKAGDNIKEGQVLGVISEPTKYYVKEGSNLYFKVEQNDESVNPLLLLR